MSLDLRDWLVAVEKRGELKRLNGVDWNLEIGVLTEMFSDRRGPALLFDEIPGYAKGERVLSNALAPLTRMALTFGMQEDLTPLEFVRQFKDKLRVLKPRKLTEVKDGPVLENVAEGEEVDLFRFPTPKWHDQDGGRYIGTGDVVIMRDPDTGWINAAPYRVQVHEKNLAGIFMARGNNGCLIRQKYWDKGEACPIAVVVGLHPMIWASSSMRLAEGVSELELAGGLAGVSLSVIKGKYTGLPIPAEAEIVLEGELPPIERRYHREAPFGEFTGYYTWSDEHGPVIEVKRVMWRNNPIILGAPPISPPGGNPLNDCLPAAQLWKELEERGMPGLEAVWIMPGGVGFIVVVAIDQQYEGHAKDVASTVFSLRGTGRFVIVVDADIDPSNEQEVLWALATRCNPQDAVQIVQNYPMTFIDPLGLPEDRKKVGQLKGSRAALLACRPFSWRDRFPVVNRFGEEVRQAVLKKWAACLD